MRALGNIVTLVTCAALVGCASAPMTPLRAPERPKDVPGEAVTRHWETVKRPDVELFVQSWAPPQQPEFVVVFHHGLRDHSERYDGWARRVVAKGGLVVALDMRGHGRSSGRRTWIEDFQVLVDDLDAVMGLVRTWAPGMPVILYGHSVGGMVATLYAEQHSDQLAGVAVSAPALQIERLPVEAAATRMFAAVGPDLALLDTPFERFSRTPEVVQAMREDPLVDQDVGPAVTAAALVEAIHRAWQHVDGIQVPLLALHGTGDALTDPRGCASLVKRLGARATLKLYPGAYHDLQHEPEGPQVLADFLAFLDQVLRDQRDPSTE